MHLFRHQVSGRSASLAQHKVTARHRPENDYERFGMCRPFDELMSKHEAATSCGCGCNEDYAAYLDQNGPISKDTDTRVSEEESARLRESVRRVFESRAARSGPVND